MGSVSKTKCLWAESSQSLSTDVSGQLDIPWHDGDSLCMDSTQIGIFEQTYKICFRCFL